MMKDHLNITNRVAADHGGAIRTKAAKEQLAVELKKAGVPNKEEIKQALLKQRESEEAPKKPKETGSDLNKTYSSLAKQAQEAVNKGDMTNGLRLQKEAMSVMEKIRAEEEKQNPKAQEKEQSTQRVLSDLKKVKVSDTTKLSSDSKGVYITDKVGNNEVKTLITPKSDGSFEIGYKINGSYAKSNVTDNREKVRLALVAKRQFEQALSALKEGTKVRAVAFDDDGGGELRRKAYEKLGFKHQGNNVMTGIISGGKVQGMDFAEAGDSAKVWLQVVFPK